jgi:hypothetical protein
MKSFTVNIQSKDLVEAQNKIAMLHHKFECLNKLVNYRYLRVHGDSAAVLTLMHEYNKIVNASIDAMELK